MSELLNRYIVEVDGHRHVHEPDPQLVIERLGNRLDIGEMTYDIMGYNIAQEYNVFCAKQYVNWSLKNMHIPFITVIIYMLLVYFGQKWMLKRNKFQIKKYLIWWNLGLSIFSTIGMFYTLPRLLGILYYGGLEYAICAPAEGKYAHGNLGRWVTLFIFSKFPELIDTAFIVLRKTKLIFLHWYHHVTVLLFCWHAFATRSGNALFFVAMNYSVHAVMYFYYFQAARGHRPPWAKFVTVIQISQMFIGVMVCVMTYYYWNQGKMCDVDRDNFMYAGIMYLSYLWLFVWFALQRYVFKKPQNILKVKKNASDNI